MTHERKPDARRIPPAVTLLLAGWLLLVPPAQLGLAADATLGSPPETTITAVLELIDGAPSPLPPGNVTVSRAIAFEFTGSDDVGIVGFECSVDGSAFAPCLSPRAFDQLDLGEYEFAVRAVDTEGIRDASPASSTVIVDEPPETSITSAIDSRGKTILNGGTSRSHTFTFAFAGTESVANTRPVLGHGPRQCAKCSRRPRSPSRPS